MHMTFWWDTKINDYLIYGFNIKTIGALVVVCIIVAIFAFIFEWLRFLQTRQRQKELILRAKQISLLCLADGSPLLHHNIADRRNPLNITYCDRSLLFGAEVSIWFFLQILGYLLMLTAMLYNAWLFIACIVGGGVGYFMFGQKFMKVNMQNCQIIRDTYCMATSAEPGNPSCRDGESTPALERPSTSRMSSCASEVNTNVVVHQ